jgi:hypothetical protein|nr:MAG TPA: YopX protein [Caudoviricetes sp.]DAS71676.1 MAG TPA: YopX protein [Caudoviricetes sp.]
MITKFRAWDKETQTMLDVSLIDFKKSVLIGEHWEFGETNFINFDEIELMQSTGLFDKEGTEVFEGDIIAIEVEEIETPINAKIFQNNKIGVLMFHVFEDNEDVPMVELLEDNSVAFAVIGNIYENPELLEVEE